jgi:hypothetical protein
MMKRHVGEGHWWRWQVLTEKNPDPLRRPIFDDQTAQKIFAELKGRNLLVEFNVNVDGSGVPVYLMRYDIEGWDKAVAEGRPIYGTWLKVRRNWPMIVLAFILGCLLTSLENRSVGLIDKAIEIIVRPWSTSEGASAETRSREVSRKGNSKGLPGGPSTPPNQAAPADQKAPLSGR